MAAKPTRLDSRLFEGSDELVYLCLPDWFRNSLLSLTERMLWSRVWLDENWEDYHLTESDKKRIEYGIWRLSQDDCSMGDCCDEIPGIIARLEELENMNINVNCGGGCGCGCGSTNIAKDDAPPSDYLTPPPITGNIPEVIEGSALQHKCNMANYLMYSLRLAAIQSANFTGGYESWADYWHEIFGMIEDVNLTKFAYNPYITFKAALSGVTNTDVVIQPFDVMYNDLVCSIYSAPNSQAAADNVDAMLKAGYTDYFVRTMMTEIASQLPYDAAFDMSLVSNLPVSFQNRDCSQCGGGSADLPTPPTGFVLIPLVSSDIVEITQEGGTNTHTFNESATQFTYNAIDGEWNASTVHLNTQAIKDRADVTHLFGCVLQVTSTNASDAEYDNIVELLDQLPGTYHYHLPGKTNVKLARYKSDDYASDEVYKDWIDQFDEIGAYGAAAIAPDDDLTAWQVATRHNKNVVYKVWMIGKV